MDLDIALRMEHPTTMDSSSSVDEVNYKKQESSSRISLMIIKCGRPEAFVGVVFEEITNVLEFLIEIENRFGKNDKEETSAPFLRLITTKYKDKGNVMEHIMQHISYSFKT